MIAVVQRVLEAEVRFRHAGEPESWELAGRISAGVAVLLGVERGDGPREAEWMARKIAKLRIFEDDAGRMNHDVAQQGGAVLLVSQFTLCGDCSGGNRPSFIDAAAPEVAEPLVEAVAHTLRASHGLAVETGRFRTEMRVSLVNDGPVTIVLRSSSAAT
jgi:D-tyrosyl-tRNA(Tyr) deacylase